jgi:hypothetical protein
VSGFDAVNEAIKTSGGGYVKTKNKGESVEGIVLDVQVRDKVFEGKIVPKQDGTPRKEWLFTLETAEGIIKYTANEGAQTAVRNALAQSGAAKIEKGGKIRFTCTQEFKRGTPNQFQEFEVVYSAPKFVELADGDEPPF